MFWLDVMFLRLILIICFYLILGEINELLELQKYYVSIWIYENFLGLLPWNFVLKWCSNFELLSSYVVEFGYEFWNFFLGSQETKVEVGGMIEGDGLLAVESIELARSGLFGFMDSVISIVKIYVILLLLKG